MILTKTEKSTGIVLAILLLLLTLSGSGYFFFTLKVNFVQWLAYNACSPSSLVYLACFIADVLFRHYGTLHIHVEWRQYLCPTVAYHNDAQLAMGRLHPLPHR